MWVKLQHSQVGIEGCQVITSSHPENIPRSTPHGGNEDEVGRWTDEGITAGTIPIRVTGMNVAVTRMMGAGLPRTRVMLGLVLYPGVELPQNGSVLLGGHVLWGLVYRKYWCSWGWFLWEPSTAKPDSQFWWCFLLTEVTESLISSHAGPVPCRVQATVDKILSAGSSENWTLDDQTLSSDGPPAMRMGPTGSYKSCPAGLSPLGESATTDKLGSARSSKNWN